MGTDGLNSTHRPRVDTSCPRGKSWYTPACSCGWVGGKSSKVNLAMNDIMLHLNYQMFPA